MSTYRVCTVIIAMYSVFQLRCGLLLLKNGVNKYPYEIFYSGQSEDILLLLITVGVTNKGHDYLRTYRADDCSLQNTVCYLQN